jgi:hypothetical protein
MATLSITVPNNIATRVADAICNLNGYQETISDGNGGTIPNPQTKLEFVKHYVINVLKNQVISYEGRIAADAANLAAIQTAQAEIILT